MEKMQAAPAPAFAKDFYAGQQFCTLLHVPSGSKVVAVKRVDHNLPTPTVR
jgi:hypothetical protein